MNNLIIFCIHISGFYENNFDIIINRGVHYICWARRGVAHIFKMALLIVCCINRFCINNHNFNKTSSNNSGKVFSRNSVYFVVYLIPIQNAKRLKISVFDKDTYAKDSFTFSLVFILRRINAILCNIPEPQAISLEGSIKSNVSPLLKQWRLLLLKFNLLCCLNELILCFEIDLKL